MFKIVLNIKKVINLLELILDQSHYGYNTNIEDNLVKARVILDSIILEVRSIDNGR